VSTIVVTQDPMHDVDLRAHADRQLLQIGKNLREFDLLESRVTELGGQPAIYMRFAWTSAHGPLEQSLTMVERPEEAGRVVTTFTTSTPRNEAESARIVFARMLATVEFERPAPAMMRSEPFRIVPEADPPPYIPMPGIRDRRR
jgi:hypothetical protein